MFRNITAIGNDLVFRWVPYVSLLRHGGSVALAHTQLLPLHNER
jgi:hypothetical protein